MKKRTTSRAGQQGDVRRRRLAAIHAEAKRLQLDDATYRALLHRVAGVTSSRNCTPEQLGAVVAELRRLGGKPEREVMAARAYAGKPKAMTPMLQKIEALLAEAGREWAYAHGLARRMFKAQRLEWLGEDRLHKLVAALQIDANRRAKSP